MALAPRGICRVPTKRRQQQCGGEFEWTTSAVSDGHVAWHISLTSGAPHKLGGAPLWPAAAALAHRAANGALFGAGKGGAAQLAPQRPQRTWTKRLWVATQICQCVQMMM